MKTIIQLNERIKIDLVKLIDSRLLVQANSGGGKSWLLRRLLEQSHGKVQQIIIDLEGEFSTLREKYDYILAGKGGDVVAETKTASLLARKILEMNVSAIIDLYELPHYERKHFVKLFLDSLVNSPKELWHPCLVVVDEAHQFCPEKGQSEAMEAVIDLATRGRKRGFCAVLATQRLSKLHKDAAAECNNKLIGRTGLDIDMKRAAEELGFTSKEQYLSLRKLDPGEFFVYGPAISNEVIKAKVGTVLTTHPRAAGKGFKVSKKMAPPTDRIKSILKKLTDLPQEAQKEMNTVADLKKEISNLRHQLRIAGQNKTASPEMIKKSVEMAIIKRDKEWGTRTGQERRLWRNEVDKFYKVKRDLGNIVAIIGEPNYPEPHCPTYVIPSGKDAGKISEFGFPSLEKQITPLRKIPVETKENPENLDNGELSLTNSERRILDAIAWMESIGINEPEQTAIAFLAGYKFGGGAFNNPRGSLRTKGMVNYIGNKIILTDFGRQMAKAPETALNTEELHRKVLSILRGPERKILEVLLEIYPNDISNEDLAVRAGYSAGGGGYNNPRGRLRSLGLIEYRGSQVVAKSVLFLE
ncbi:MAG TPA: DUF87 domain-containing protein [bacterium]|nr:DUF87 domain-containing protein [bacterium]